MPTVNKVTPVLFSQIKDELDYVDPTTSAIRNHLSVKTILQIKGSETFKDYEQQKIAQHPPNQSTMRDDLKEIKQMLITILNLAKENRLL